MSWRHGRTAVWALCILVAGVVAGFAGGLRAEVESPAVEVAHPEAPEGADTARSATTMRG